MALDRNPRGKKHQKKTCLQKQQGQTCPLLKRRTTLCDVRRWESLQTIWSKQGSWNHGNVFTEPCSSSKEAATNPCNWGDEQIRCGSTHFRNGTQAGGSPEWLSRLSCHKSNMPLTGPGQMLGLPLSPNHAAFPSLGMHMKLVPYSHCGRSSGLESCNEGGVSLFTVI